MTETPSSSEARPKPKINEDWAATLTGLTLLLLCLIGLIPEGLIP